MWYEQQLSMFFFHQIFLNPMFSLIKNLHHALKKKVASITWILKQLFRSERYVIMWSTAQPHYLWRFWYHPCISNFVVTCETSITL